MPIHTHTCDGNRIPVQNTSKYELDKGTMANKFKKK
jgi:hypothetical protein